MENDAPHEFRGVDLEAQIAHLHLTITHHLQDNEMIRHERDEYKARFERIERELGELRGKYENLKRRFNGAPPLPPPPPAMKRRRDPEAEGGDREREMLLGMVRTEKSPDVEPFLSKTETQHNPEAPIVRKISTDISERLWETNASFTSQCSDRTNDPRKRPRVDPTSSPDLSIPIQRSSSSLSSMAIASSSSSSSVQSDSSSTLTLEYPQDDPNFKPRSSSAIPPPAASMRTPRPPNPLPPRPPNTQQQQYNRRLSR
ncbi:hypothetical protein R3P38DRAFT_2951349 [Favolaschia claudopus]|uniref:Uncharacterized protein n=1 Tax=Favolaschia claudopus TaxID=2862362 RepID=A0AAW0BGP3_9AGAR